MGVEFFLSVAAIVVSVLALIFSWQAKKKTTKVEGAHNALAKDYDETKKLVEHHSIPKIKS